MDATNKTYPSLGTALPCYLTDDHQNQLRALQLLFLYSVTVLHFNVMYVKRSQIVQRHYISKHENIYCRLAELWMSNFHVYELTEAMSQQEETAFAELLSRLRLGRQTTHDMGFFKSQHIDADDAIYDTHTHTQILAECRC